MEKRKTELTMLGTGNALATKCYNACFIIKAEGGRLMVDAGGGNGVLSQLEKAGEAPREIRDLFITHAHTDHMLGAVWMARVAVAEYLNGTRDGPLEIYGHSKVLGILEQICRMTFTAGYSELIGETVFFREIADGERLEIGGMSLQFFDIFSEKEKQFGFRAALPGGKSLVCLGDEPFNEKNRSHAEKADWLMCEAFCLHADRELFKPRKKGHGTALEAGIAAERLEAKNLILHHTEDKSLKTRKTAYAKEASKNFSGPVFVPDDLERIILE